MLKTALKLLLPIGLFYWLLRDGKLDFSLITQAFHLGYLWILGVLFLILRSFICALRFKLLLDTKSQTPNSYLKVFSFDAIGNLFSVTLFGATSGDIIRFFFYKKLSSDLTPGRITAFFAIDRLIGLMGLMTLATLVCGANFNQLKLNPNLMTLILLNAGILIVVTIGTILIFSDKISPGKKMYFFSKYLKNWPKIHGFLDDMLSIQLATSVFIKCLLLSMLNYFCIITGFWFLIAPFIEKSIPTLDVLTILPIGLVGAALPISPAGLGVGHVLFANLFKLIQINQGASLFNLYFVANLFVFCAIGIIPYLYTKK